MTAYIGRFAPSPTGPLHLGSVVAALGSWLDARSNGGKWLLRIEDVDETRTVPGADSAICKELERLGLHWDEAPLIQSERKDYYHEALKTLRARQLVYACQCSRKTIRETATAQGAEGLIYPGNCRSLRLAENHHALRLKVGKAVIEWSDILQGTNTSELELESGDFVIRRADGLFSYQLAVTVDDYLQGVTRIVRGNDLKASTPRQIQLQRQLGYSTPEYLHLPLVTDLNGSKWSKQGNAAAISAQAPGKVLLQALKVLQQPLEDHAAEMPVAETLALAVKNWNPARIAGKTVFPIADDQ